MADDYIPGSSAEDYTNLPDFPSETGANDAPYGPPNPYEASPDEPGSYGPPTDIFSGSSHVDDAQGDGPAAGKVDYSSLFASVVTTTGNVAKAVTGTGIPPAVAAATSSAAAAGQNVLNRQTQVPIPRPVAATPKPSVAAPRTSTGALVAIGLGSSAMVGLLLAAASNRGKR